MASKKTSQLTSGTPVQSTDMLPAARAGVGNVKIPAADFATAAQGTKADNAATAAALAAHAGAPDPHPLYALESGLGSAAAQPSSAFATAAQGDLAAAALPRSGGSMTGPIVLTDPVIAVGDAQLAIRAMTKRYVDLAAAVENTWNCFGDSRSADWSIVTTDTASSQLAYTTNISPFAFASWVNGGRMELAYNGGIGGNHTGFGSNLGSPNMRARYQTDAIAAPGKNVVMLGGTNDSLSPSAPSAQRDEALAIWSNLYAMSEDILASGKRLMLCFEGPESSQNKNYLFNLLNDMIQAYGVGKRNFKAVDINEAKVDALSATGQPLTGMLVDGVHHGVRGGLNVGLKIAEAAAPWVGTDPFPLPTSVMNTRSGSIYQRNICNNPFMTGTGGTFTGFTGAHSGSVPTGWNLAGTADVVCSSVARADGMGNDFVMDVTASASGQYVILSYLCANGALVAGDTPFLAGSVGISGITPGVQSGLYPGGFYGSVLDGLGHSQIMGALGNYRQAGSFDRNISGVLRGLSKTLIATTTGQPSITSSWIFNAAGTATIKHGRILFSSSSAYPTS